MKICGIYKGTNIVNKKHIIGQSVNIYHRWVEHKCYLRKNKHPNPHLQYAWNKYGEQNFKFEIILECPEEKLNEEEIRLIKEYNSNDRRYGYNIEEGGNGHPCSEETKRKMSKAHKNISEETKRKISKAQKGKVIPEETRKKISKSLTGRKMSEETKKRMSKAQKNKKHTEETKRKISEAHMGKKCLPFTEGHKQKISKSLKGNKNSLGRKLSEETKRKISKNNKGKIFSEETKRKMSEAKKNMSKENRIKISNALKLHYAKKKLKVIV